MTGLPPAPCAVCLATVMPALLLAQQEGGVRPVPVPADPAEVAYDPAKRDLLLCVGVSSGGQRVLIPLDAPGSARVARGMRKPHCHRVHVCPTFPTEWTTAAVAVVEQRAPELVGASA